MVAEKDKGSMRGGDEAGTPDSFSLLVREGIVVGAIHEMVDNNRHEQRN